jgi:hypothetical protein
MVRILRADLPPRPRCSRGAAAVSGRARNGHDRASPRVPSRGRIYSAAKLLGRNCGRASAIGADDAYLAKPALPEAPVFRIVCGGTWYEIDGASGALLDRLDSSRRAYRWLFGGLHTLDFPPLRSSPWLRTIAIVALCAGGLAFSLTGAVLAWRRLRASVGEPFEENRAARGRAP